MRVCLRPQYKIAAMERESTDRRDQTRQTDFRQRWVGKKRVVGSSTHWQQFAAWFADPRAWRSPS